MLRCVAVLCCSACIEVQQGLSEKVISLVCCVLQCVAVCCSVLQCVAELCCSVCVEIQQWLSDKVILQSVAVCCSMSLCCRVLFVAACCSVVLQ